jgi:hypothetical protein
MVAGKYRKIEKIPHCSLVIITIPFCVTAHSLLYKTHSSSRIIKTNNVDRICAIHEGAS